MLKSFQRLLNLDIFYTRPELNSNLEYKNDGIGKHKLSDLQLLKE